MHEIDAFYAALSLNLKIGLRNISKTTNNTGTCLPQKLESGIQLIISVILTSSHQRFLVLI